MLARRRCPFLLLLLLLLLCATGCRNRTASLEAADFNRQQMYEQTLAEMHAAEARANALQLENNALRSGARLPPEVAAQTFGLKRIVLGRSTGGADLDRHPGDELLEVYVEPRDSDDHTIKSPGTLQIFALETSPQGLKVPLCSWEISPDELRRSWKQGLLSTGYGLSLPWKKLPIFENVRVIVRLITPDQRVFEADKDIKVRLVPGAAQRRCEPDAIPLPAPTPLPAETGPLLVPSSGTAPYVTQWRPLPQERPVAIARPVPLNAPPPDAQ
jgi:hypothetical protein